MESWKQYFLEVLKGIDERRVAEKRSLLEDEEDDLTDEKIGKQIRRLKRKKAAGHDGVKNETWMSIWKSK